MGDSGFFFGIKLIQIWVKERQDAITWVELYICRYRPYYLQFSKYTATNTGNLDLYPVHAISYSGLPEPYASEHARKALASLAVTPVYVSSTSLDGKATWYFSKV